MKKRSRKTKWIVIGICGIAIVAAAIYGLTRPKTSDLASATAKKKTISTYRSFSGNVETKHRQTVTSEKAMQISDIYVSEGEKVKDGDALYKTSMGEKVKAKIDGVVTSVDVEENDQVMAGVKLLEIVDTDHLKIKVKVNEYDLSAMKVNKSTWVTIDAINKKIKGKVKRLSEEGITENGVTYFEATLDLKHDKSVKVGMSAEVKMLNKKAKDVIALPMKAVEFNDDNKPYVLKKDANGTIVETDIKTGINDGDYVEVKSGISEDESVYYSLTSAQAESGFGSRPSSQSSSGGANNG